MTHEDNRDDVVQGGVLIKGPVGAPVLEIRDRIVRANRGHKFYVTGFGDDDEDFR